MAEIIIFVGDLFTIYDQADVSRPDNLLVEIPANTIEFADYAQWSVTPVHKIIEHQLTLQQHVQVTPYHFTLSDTLTFSQSITRSKIGIAQNYLSFYQSTRKVLYYVLEDVLALTDEVSVVIGLFNQITFSQSLSYHIIHKEIVTQQLVMSGAATIYKANNPGFVIGAEFSSPPAFSAVSLGYVPDVGPSTTLVLNIPQFDDQDEIEHQRVNRETRAGTKIIFHDPLWPVIERLKFKFENLSQVKVKQLLDFVQMTLGQNIFLRDHYGVNWYGIITNPEATAEQSTTAFNQWNQPSDWCFGFAIELDFEGNRV
jgi:hypothetical protein